MTLYEDLMRRANKCLEGAKKTEGLMRSIWLRHFYALRQAARNLELKDAQENVEV